MCFFTSISHINQSQFLSWSWQRRPPKMDEENELKASFQKLSKNLFWFDWTKSIFLHQSWKKSVKRCIFSNSISLGFFADSHVSQCSKPIWLKEGIFLTDHNKLFIYFNCLFWIQTLKYKRTLLIFPLSILYVTNTYLKKLVMIAHLGNDLWWALEQAIACSMTIISWIFKVIRKTWQIRKTPTIPMKTMAKLSSVLLRAWWLIVAWLLLWRRRSCLSLMSL